MATYANDILDKQTAVLLDMKDGHLSDKTEPGGVIEGLTGETVEEPSEEEQTIQEQIRGEGEDPSGEVEEPEVTEEEPSGEGDAIDALLKAGNVEREDFFKIPIPLGDERGEVSIEALKDQYVEAERFREKQQELTEEMATQQNELMVKRRLVDQVVTALGPNLTPEIEAQINQLNQDAIARERRLVVEAIPTWSDSKTVASDLQAITEFAGGYGYTQADINGIVDHRLWKMLRDVSLGYKQIKEARKKRKPPVQPKTKKPGRTNLDLKGLISRAEKSGSQRDKADAMLGIIGASNVNR